MKNSAKSPTTKPTRSQRAANVAILGVTLALMVILQLFASLLQKLGMPMSLALGLIPAMVIAETHGIKFGVICGGFFGLFTLIFSAIYASAIPIYTVTINPLVSVLPRLACGAVCALSYHGFSRLSLKRNPNQSIAKRRVRVLGLSAVSAVLGVLTNTVLYLGLFFVFAHGKTYGDTVIDLKWLLTAVAALNTVIELVLFAVVVPPITYAMTQSKLAKKLYVKTIDSECGYAQNENENPDENKDLTDNQNDCDSD